MSRTRSSRRIIIGITLIVLMAAIAISGYQAKIRHARESVLQLNLNEMRSVIKYYIQDKHRAPQSLQDLVDAGYFRALPVDITNSNSTWKPEIGDVVISAEKTAHGIADVRSGSSAQSSNGTAYNTW